MKMNKEYHNKLKEQFDNNKAYKLFCEIMKEIINLVEKKENNY